MSENTPVERFNWHTFIATNDKTPDGLIAELNGYFEPFAQPPTKVDDDGLVSITEEHPCLKCGKPLLGMVSFMMGGGFEWGLVHGEGRCSVCRWPARAYHFIKWKDDRAAITLRGFILQYHPDFVTGVGA